MKKVVFAAMVATGTLFLSTLNSCSKVEEPTPLVAQLEEQVNYHVPSIKHLDVDVLPIVTWQFNAESYGASTIQLNMNEVADHVNQLKTSSIRTTYMPEFQQRTLRVVKTSGNTVSISFLETNYAYAGSYNPADKRPSEVLLQKQLLTYHNDGGGGQGWYSYSAQQLSGVYTISKTLDGFRLTRMDQEVIIELEKELKD